MLLFYLSYSFLIKFAQSLTSVCMGPAVLHNPILVGGDNDIATTSRPLTAAPRVARPLLGIIPAIILMAVDVHNVTTTFRRGKHGHWKKTIH